MSKLKLATVWLDGCSGCHMSFLDMDERLLELAWGYDFAGDTRAVDSAIKRLRAKLRLACTEADSIEAVRGVGYRLNP